MCVSVYVYATCVHVPVEVREGVRAPGAGPTGSYGSALNHETISPA